MIYMVSAFPGRPAHNAHPQTCSGEPLTPEEMVRKERERQVFREREREIATKRETERQVFREREREIATKRETERQVFREKEIVRKRNREI